LAKCIHYSGGRRTRPFVEVNCAAIPPTLLESELFGHERGAFTDAHAARAGLFETADRGTLFLDEISSTPAAVQAKLLTALEEKRIRRIGGRQPMQVDVQIIAATHTDLKEAVRLGTFRADLYHRLNVVTVRMPSLRDRGEDRISLAESFVARTCKEYGLPTRTLSADARRYLLEYPWPGNVRELKNQIERIVLLYNDSEIDIDQFDVRRSSLPPAIPTTGFHLSLPDEGVSLDDIEREAIRVALDRCSGNVSQAARFLRVTRQTVIYRMKKYGLSGDTSDLE
jgi:two-component system, NtrC family, response regulator AtoC